jgi:ribosomal protein L17
LSTKRTLPLRKFLQKNSINSTLTFPKEAKSMAQVLVEKRAKDRLLKNKDAADATSDF